MKRNLRYRVIVSVCLTLLLAAMAVAQDKPAAKPTDKPAPALPSANQIIDKFVQAIGGKAAVEKLSSRQAKGTFDLPAMGVSAPMEVYSKAPNKTYMTIDIPGFGAVQRGYDGTVGWSSSPQEGLRELTGGELSQMKIGSDFYRDVKLLQLFPKMTVKGIEKVSDHDAYVVEATSADGFTEKMFFDVQSGLLVRTDYDAETAQGKMPMSSVLSDYREVDGVKVPFSTSVKSAVMEYTVKIDSVKHNVAVEDTKFAKPAGQ